MVVLVNSWDGYRNCWEYLCHSFGKYWPDCPWEVRIVTNELDTPCGRALKVGGGTKWGSVTRRALENVGSPVIFYMHEDHWLTKRPNTSVLVEWVELMSGTVDHIQLSCGWKYEQAEREFEDDRLIVLKRDTQYRTSNQAGLWNVGSFLRILRDKDEDRDNGYQFDQWGGYRDPNMVCLAVKENRYFPYVSPNSGWESEPVVRGKWTEAARIYAEREGLSFPYAVGERVVC